MKQKTHSGAKKRFRVRKSGVVMAQKANKRHLLVNKSKGQKSAHDDGYPVNVTKVKAIRKLMPGKVVLQAARKVKKAERDAARA